MFDFPNSPSVGQRVTGVGGIVYVWDGVKWTNSVGGVTVQSMGDVGRNLIHNPLFNIAQRGVGPYTTAAIYTLDRWLLDFNLDTNSVNQVALNDVNRAGIGDEAAVAGWNDVCTGNAGAAAYTRVLQRIEGVRRLSGKTVTVSFWAWCSAGTPKIGVSLDQYFGTGGSPSASVNGNGQAIILNGTTPVRYSLTFTLPSVAGMTTGTNRDDYTVVSFWLSSGATQNVRAGGIGVQTINTVLWGVQLEIGTVATPLEKPDPRYDLSNCQRFFQVGFFGISGYSPGTGVGFEVPSAFSTTMRATPTMVLSGTTTTNVTANVCAASIYGIDPFTQTSAAGGFIWKGQYSASADL